MPNTKIVRITIDISADQYAHIEMLAAEEGLTLEEFVLKCLPHPEGMVDYIDFAEQKRLAEEIMNRNQEVLNKLSE